MTHDEITAALRDERSYQNARWGRVHPWGRGDCSSPDVPMVVKAGVLVEEAGEVMKAVLNAGPEAAKTDVEVKNEAIQTMAVAYAILEGM